MDPTKYQHVATVTIAAPPEEVYDLVADVTRMGEWSPVCTGAEWLDEGHAWFLGTNTTSERTWQTQCRVAVAERGREFTFFNCGFERDGDLVRWSYTFAPTAGGTEVTESWQVMPAYEGFMRRIAPHLELETYLDGVVPTTQQGMAETLAKLKDVAEAR